jgi:hypothetical protein
MLVDGVAGKIYQALPDAHMRRTKTAPTPNWQRVEVNGYGYTLSTCLL